MAGLSRNEREQEMIRGHRDRLVQYVGQFPWQWILVLTVSNFPGTESPRFSAKRLVASAYPAFLRQVKQQVGQPVQDCWVVERGETTNRVHMNVLLASSALIPQAVFEQAWWEVASSFVHAKVYDPKEGPGYWIKDLTSVQADVAAYGGSVIYRFDAPPAAKPRRMRKSDYNRARALGGIAHRACATVSGAETASKHEKHALTAS